MNIKGFRPTGFGTKSGFDFSAKRGFTGSTGSVTSVASYTRRKGYATGGFVKEGYQPKVEQVGDSGHATVQRSKPTTNLDQESGGKTPLRPGFKKGGKAKKSAGGALGAALAPAAPRLAARAGRPMMRRGDGGKIGGIARLVKSVMGKAKKPAAEVEAAVTQAPASPTYEVVDRRTGLRTPYKSRALRDANVERKNRLEGTERFAPIDSDSGAPKRRGGPVKMSKS